MNAMRFLLPLLLCAGMALAADEGFFPIMVWNGTPADAQELSRMKECGITVAGFCAPANLSKVEAAGLKAFVGDARASTYTWTNVDPAVAEKNTTALVKDVGSSPAAFGYFLDDEPNTSAFAGLGKVGAQIREKSGGKLTFINLFPTYATDDQLGAKTGIRIISINLSRRVVRPCCATTIMR